MSFIDIKNLVFEYFRRDEEGNVDEMVEALSDVSLEVEKGDFIAVLGRNGSGKSTLAKQINALLTPSDGEVIVDGMDTENEELRLEIRKTAGMVFQNPDNQIVGSVVEEDVAFGPENLGYSTEKIWNQVDGALLMTDMDEYRNNSPNKLSGGQKQRVAIAGVLAMEPQCIIFDEATAMLDPISRKQMVDTAVRLNKEKGITVIWITHHMDEVLFCDKVIVMNDGRIAGQGTPREIFADEDILAECGLAMPQWLQYVRFLEDNEIIYSNEAASIESEEQLVEFMCKKYGQSSMGGNSDKYSESDIDGQDYDNSLSGVDSHINNYRVHNNDDSSDKSNNPACGILLNEVTYIYNKGYANERAALNNVTIHIGKGEFVAVVGHTGSGKSTLMQHLNGLLIPHGGNVYYDGKDIADKDFPIKELRQKVGLVFQYPEYQLFAETVEQDVSFGPMNMDIPKVEAQRRAYKAIEAVGLPDTIYDTSPLTMSGGQKRRVAIAGVLAMEPEYLVLDEPTAGLDPLAAKQLLDMLKKLHEERGMTIVMVSHNMEEVAEYASRIIAFDNGKVCLDGETGFVFSDSNVIEKLGLKVPLGIHILNALKNVGVNVDASKHIQLDVYRELMKLKEIHT